MHCTIDPAKSDVGFLVCFLCWCLHSIWTPTSLQVTWVSPDGALFYSTCCHQYLRRFKYLTKNEHYCNYCIEISLRVAVYMNLSRHNTVSSNVDNMLQLGVKLLHWRC